MPEDLPVPITTVEKQTPEANFTELGRSGVERSGGIITEEFLNDLQGDKGIRRYKEMSSNDPIIGACLRAIEMVVKQASWSVEPASDDPEDQRIAEFVQSNLHDMDRPWEQFVSDALSMIVYGWSFFEVVYKRRQKNTMDPINGSQFDDGRIGWRKLAPRQQDSLFDWKFDENGNVIAMRQQPAPEYRLIEIPMSKGLLFRAASGQGNPEGVSALRNAYRPWFFKKRLEEIEAIGVERDLNGIPVFWVPQRILTPDATEDEKATLSRIESMLENVRQDRSGGLILPAVFDDSNNKLFDFELLSSRGRRSHDTSGIITRYNQAIAGSLLADFILIGHSSVGSFALASSKTKLFSTAIGAYLDEIQNIFNLREIPRLLAFNGWTDVELPKLVHGDVETIELDQLAQYITALTRDAGFRLTGDTVQEHLLSQAGVPSDAAGDVEVGNEPEEGRGRRTPQNSTEEEGVDDAS